MIAPSVRLLRWVCSLLQAIAGQQRLSCLQGCSRTGCSCPRTFLIAFRKDSRAQDLWPWKGDEGMPWKQDEFEENAQWENLLVVVEAELTLMDVSCSRVVELWSRNRGLIMYGIIFYGNGQKLWYQLHRDGDAGLWGITQSGKQVTGFVVLSQ